ncbi:hypothetical protein RRG08_045886 [Elysia crispata]|uniref:Uncharacterized protein n=1 Tax=Elysia crispata TaxID=231223 RepID=A0AAE0ZEP4_9GAST|nr:hypothetical protein RRG08_045886 [Elysia crispata]
MRFIDNRAKNFSIFSPLNTVFSVFQSLRQTVVVTVLPQDIVPSNKAHDNDLTACMAPGHYVATPLPTRIPLRGTRVVRDYSSLTGFIPRKR